MPESWAKFIVKNRDKIGIAFGIFLVISLMLIPFVNINYDLAKYIPDTEPSKRGLNVVEEEFGMQGTARIMVNNVSLLEAKEYKSKIESIPGVDMVVWLDDSIDVKRPESFIPQDKIDEYYKDGSAVFDVMFEKDDYADSTNDALTKIFEMLPEDSNLSGAAVNAKSTREAVSNEVTNLMMLLIPSVIIILILTTNSYFSPILFVVVIGTSILMNMGTNVFLESVSFSTYSIVAALQMAVSMDYSVFMLHQFEFEKEKNPDFEIAMIETLKHSGLSICASALTTVAGFLALAFMHFTIGKDMGLVFAKGIVLSLFCVIFMMPCLIIRSYKLIEKTSHKSFIPNLTKMAKVADKLSIVLIAIVLVIVIPSYFAQRENNFLFGVAAYGGGEGTRAHEDEEAIVNKFGRSSPLIVLVPKGDYVTEKTLVNELDEMKAIKKVQSLTNLVPEGIPDSFIPRNTYEKFRSENYSRILIYTKTGTESTVAFDTINQIRASVEKYYGDNYEMTGQGPVTMDTKNMVSADYIKVNIISILAVMTILMFTFRSFLIPILLILVIEGGIFINMAIPYYAGYSVVFVGYLIVSSVQLGATIDYAILFTNNYLTDRKTMESKEGSIHATALTIPSILTSGGILICAGYLLKFTSSLTAISEMGELIGRGAFLSMLLVAFFLPHILKHFDKPVMKSIWKKKGAN